MALQLKQVESLLDQKEQELARLELQRATILDSLPANVCVLDQSGTITFVNQTWRRFAQDNGVPGFTTGFGANYLAICDAARDDPAATTVAAAIRAVLAGHSNGFESDYPCHGPDAQRWFRCMIRPIIGGALIMHLDVTEKKMAELEMLRAQAAMTAVSEQKSRLLANLSHELRTPLNAIIGFSEVMATEALGQLSPRYAEYARDIHLAGRHLLNVVNDLLDLTRIETGNLRLEPEPIMLGALAEEVAVFFRNQVAEKRLLMVWNIPDDLVVVADELRLRQIIINLLSNAIKFTPAGGSISVEARPDAQGGVRIAVTDSGIGMSEDDIATALQLFGQIVNAQTRGHIGTGLGLPLAKQLIELQGGTLEISSKPGEGSRFVMTLPAQSGASAGA